MSVPLALAFWPAIGAALLAPVMAAERSSTTCRNSIGSVVHRVRFLHEFTSISAASDGTATAGHMVSAHPHEHGGGRLTSRPSPLLTPRRALPLRAPHSGARAP